MLAIHPDVFKKLRQSILRDLGTAPDGAGLDFHSLKNCKYLQHVLSETLRLFPSVPINTREALNDTVLPSGGGPDCTQPMALRDGDIVNFSIYAMHRRRDLWGEDALEFKVRENRLLPFNVPLDINEYHSYSRNDGSIASTTGHICHSTVVREPVSASSTR